MAHAHHTHHLFTPPQLSVGETDSSRKVSWLELFFDLVYVAAVIELGYILSSNVNPQGILNFVLLYIPIWWSWTGTTVYNNRFQSNDVIHRLLVFAQIFFVAAMAINVHAGLGASFPAFALSYALVRALLVVMYIRAGRHVPEARALTNIAATGFGIGAALWLVAAFLPEPLRYFVAAAGFAIELFAGLSPQSRVAQRALPPSANHLPERYSLFTIIVFGELYLKVIRDLSGEAAPIQSWIIGALMMGVSAALWWLYFDNIAESKVKWAKSAYVWVYGHLPLHIGITAFGVAVPKIIHEWDHLKPEYRLLLCGALALALLLIAVLERAVQTTRTPAQARTELGLRIGGVLIILAIGLVGDFDPVLIALALAVVCIVQVVVNVQFHRAAGGHIAVADEAIEIRET
ncbi:MAG: low temperature requirement protein A [Chloroflexota bacterium]|nr:low temperature requirement protein A [Chloroflexota bacterium]